MKTTINRRMQGSISKRPQRAGAHALGPSISRLRSRSEGYQLAVHACLTLRGSQRVAARNPTVGPRSPAAFGQAYCPTALLPPTSLDLRRTMLVPNAPVNAGGERATKGEWIAGRDRLR